MAKKKQAKKTGQARAETVQRIEKWAAQELPKVNVAEVEQRRQELQGWLIEYEAGDPACFGPVLQGIWRFNKPLNPKRLSHGHPLRDESLVTAEDSTHARLHRLRRETDYLIALFGVETAIAGDDMEAVMLAARKMIAGNGGELPHLQLEEVAEIAREIPSAYTPKTDEPEVCYVTMLMMSAIVGKKKCTIERLKSAGKLPPPDIEGGKGSAHEWRWSVVAPILEKHFNKMMPKVFPSTQFVRN